MKFDTTDSFKRDWKKLKPEHKAEFREVVRTKFASACDSWAEATSKRKSFVWPRSLRVDEMVSGGGIMEMTWSFASPDGRATFKLVGEGDEWICVWRRVGDHGVFTKP